MINFADDEGQKYPQKNQEKAWKIWHHHHHRFSQKGHLFNTLEMRVSILMMMLGTSGAHCIALAAIFI